LTDYLFEQANEGFTNHGPFIRQATRSLSPDFRARMKEIRQEVDRIMAGRRDARGDDGPGYYIKAAHPRIQTLRARRDMGSIQSTGRAGILTFGPYMQLAAGNYVVRIFGEVRAAASHARLRITSDAASEECRTIWSELHTEFPHPVKGLIVEHRLTLDRDVEQFEVRTFIDDMQNVAIHAVQILWTDQWFFEC
jgi:hypothetical protein